MPFQRDPSVSIRENILEQIKARLVDMREGVDGSVVTWEKVYRTPLPDQKSIRGNAVTVLEGKERKADEIGATRCKLIVAIEFVIRIKLGEEASPILNRALASIQRVMLRDQQCTYQVGDTSRQLALNMSEGGSELDIEGPGDRLVGGIVFWEVQYRHHPIDPSKLRGE